MRVTKFIDMKNVDNYYSNRKRSIDESEHEFEQVKHEMTEALKHLDYASSQIIKLDHWINEQVQKCLAQINDFDAVMPYEWIEAKESDGAIDEALWESN